MSAGEFSLIETFFSRIGESSAIELGIGDDAAVLDHSDKKTMIPSVFMKK